MVRRTRPHGELRKNREIEESRSQRQSDQITYTIHIQETPPSTQIPFPFTPTTPRSSLSGFGRPNLSVRQDDDLTGLIHQEGVDLWDNRVYH